MWRVACGVCVACDRLLSSSVVGTPKCAGSATYLADPRASVRGCAGCVPVGLFVGPARVCEGQAERLDEAVQILSRVVSQRAHVQRLQDVERQQRSHALAVGRHFPHVHACAHADGRGPSGHAQQGAHGTWRGTPW